MQFNSIFVSGIQSIDCRIDCLTLAISNCRSSISIQCFLQGSSIFIGIIASSVKTNCDGMFRNFHVLEINLIHDWSDFFLIGVFQSHAAFIKPLKLNIELTSFVSLVRTIQILNKARLTIFSDVGNQFSRLGALKRCIGSILRQFRYNFHFFSSFRRRNGNAKPITHILCRIIAVQMGFQVCANQCNGHNAIGLSSNGRIQVFYQLVVSNTFRFYSVVFAVQASIVQNSRNNCLIHSWGSCRFLCVIRGRGPCARSLVASFRSLAIASFAFYSKSRHRQHCQHHGHSQKR